jgi:hypothetical protein
VLQSALLPTVCAICVSALYIRFAIAPRVSPPISSPRRILFRSCSREPTEVTAADYRLLFPERIAVLVAGHPGHDWEALRSFAVLYDVRRFYIVYI